MSQLINHALLDRFPDNPSLRQRLIQIYLDIMPKMIGDLDACVDSGDTKQVAFLAHSVKGSSAELGAEAMGAISLQLEMAAKAGDTALIGPLAKDLADCFDKTKQVLLEADTN